jgi:hypothetical protein
VGLARSGAIDKSPFTAIIVVADDKVEVCEHGKEKSLELQESMTPVGGPFGGTERGPLGLGREGEGLVFGGHSRLRPSFHLAAGWKKRKEVLEKSRILPRELEEELDALGWTTLGGAALDADGRSGRRRTGDA